MKKTIIALVCLTMSMVVSAQPQPQVKNQACGKMEFCKDNCCKESCCQQKCCIDSATMKTVMELRKKYHENFRKELRQTLGDEKYIQYLEAKVYMLQHRAMHKRMHGQRSGQWSKHRNPMMHHGFRSHHMGQGFKKADGGKDKRDFDKDKKKDRKKDNKK